MNPAQLLHILQISDTLFPIGAFSFSDGLETAVAAGPIHIEEWMNCYVESVFIPCEGRGCAKAMFLFLTQDWKSIRELDAELTAIKPASSVRASSHSLGKRFLASCGALFDDGRIDQINAMTFPVVYGAVFSALGVAPKDGLIAFGYSRLAGTISAAQRLTALGQQQAQQILFHTLETLPAAVDRVLGEIDEPIMSFTPLLDVQQMNHRHLYSRLFRS